MAFSSLSQCLKSHCQFDSDIVGPLLPVPRARARRQGENSMNGDQLSYLVTAVSERKEREETIAVPLLIDVCI